MTELTLEEMRTQVEEAESQEAAEAAAAEEARVAPYNDLVNSPEMETVLDALNTLRQTYIGEDEQRFRKLDAAYITLKRL